MRCCLLAPADPRWGRLLERCAHEFYHLPGYASLEARRMGGTASALWAEDRGREWFLPVVIRPLPEIPGAGAPAPPWRDAVSPYGYPHPLTAAREAEVDSFLDEALAAMREFLRTERVLTVFARCSPLQPLARAYSNHGCVVEHGPCFWLDLTESAEELQGQLRSRYRSYLNALRREGVVAGFIPVPAGLDDFIQLYYRTMDRVSAARWYYFERSYFEELGALLGDALRLCVVKQRDQLLAAGLFAARGGIVQYLLSGIDERLGQPHATKLMMTFVRDWGKEAGHRILHLGGGVGGADDALSQFKRGFTRHSSLFRTWRQVVDAEQYAVQLRAWERASGMAADPIEGYFPAYRKPFVKPPLVPSQPAGQISSNPVE
jgi:hypothetical protein